MNVCLAEAWMFPNEINYPMPSYFSCKGSQQSLVVVVVSETCLNFLCSAIPPMFTQKESSVRLARFACMYV